LYWGCVSFFKLVQVILVSSLSACTNLLSIVLSAVLLGVLLKSPMIIAFWLGTTVSTVCSCFFCKFPSPSVSSYPICVETQRIVLLFTELEISIALRGSVVEFL